MHECSNDSWAEEAHDAWWDVYNEIFSQILKILKEENATGNASHKTEGIGMHYILMPFMIRNGYYDGNGWWLLSDSDN